MSLWFQEYCARSAQATTIEGWPVAVPQKVADALRVILASYDPPGDLIEQAAAQIFAASELGRSDELPGNLIASSSKTENELREFEKLTAKLIDLIDGMHGPAITALSSEGLIARDLLEPLRRAYEAAGHAGSAVDFEELPQKNPGNKPMIEAASVTQMAASFYEQITGRQPARIVDSEGEYGEWIDTLSAIFVALDIKASAKKQAQEYRTRIGRKTD